MLIGVLVGFFGVFIYGYLNASIGYAIGVAGSSLRGSMSLAISVSQTEKTQPDAKAESAIPEAEEKELSINEIPKEEPELEIDRSVCKKRYRDAIDANDAEIGREYSPDKSEQYKQRLLLLTRKLRQC